MNAPTQRLELLRQRIEKACDRAGRSANEVTLLAVSKRQPVEKIARLHGLGVVAFGENQWQEALLKQSELAHLEIEWHFIGTVQSRKTRPLADHFHWVQSVDRERVLHRLDSQRPDGMPPLNICLQVNIDDEPQKSGASRAEVAELAGLAAGLAKIRLRGLMAIPKMTSDIDEQRDSFRRVRSLFETLRQAGHELDTLSMGMSADLEAAILEGSTMVRVGTDLFGPRQT